MEAARASAGMREGRQEAVTLGASSDTLPPRQSNSKGDEKDASPRPKSYPLDSKSPGGKAKSPGGMDVDAYTLGGKGWVEYRKAGGKVYYARDRWYERDAGKWVKHSKNRPDLSILSGDEYGQWKAKRAAARERRRNRTRTHDVRQVVIE